MTEPDTPDEHSADEHSADEREAQVVAAVERVCWELLVTRVPPRVEARARTQFLRDNAAGFARDNGGQAVLVDLAALVDGLEGALRGEDGAGQDVRLALGEIPEGQRELVAVIRRDARFHPRDGVPVSPEAQALHDARVLYEVLPIGPVLLAGLRVRDGGLALDAVARDRLPVLDGLAWGGLFYSERATARAGRWASVVRELWGHIRDACDDDTVQGLLRRLSVGSDPDAARAQMVADLDAGGWLERPELRAAFATVPRHRFAPQDTPLETAYGAHHVVVTKRARGGGSMSSLSAPWVQAAQITQAGVRAGSTVIEIGSGGYQAALLVEVVGPTGRVITVDIDPEVCERTRARLEATGYGRRVEVVCADAAHRVLPDGEHVDAIIVSVGAWDIPPAWLDQLTATTPRSDRDDPDNDSPDNDGANGADLRGGVLVVPLSAGGTSRSVAFCRRDDGSWVSTSLQACGFVPMQGADAHDGRHLSVPAPSGADKQVTFTFDEPDDTPDRLDGTGPGSIPAVFAGEPAAVWPGVLVARMESMADLFLRWSSLIPGACALGAVDGAGLAGSGERWWPHAVIDNGGVSYLVTRAVADGGAELGIRTYGVRGSGGTEMVDQLLVWDRDRTAVPRFIWTPAGLPAPGLDGTSTGVLARRHGTLTVEWPHPRTAPSAGPGSAADPATPGGSAEGHRAPGT